MMGKTHLAAGLVAGEVAAIALGYFGIQADSLALIGSAAFGGLLPDIDHMNSTISRSSTMGRAASMGVAALTKHRGAVHTPLAVLVVTVVLAFALSAFPGIGYCVVMGVALGMLSHLLMDTLNPGGIMWFYPILKRHLSLAPIKTSSKGEKLLICPGMYLLAAALSSSFLPDLAPYIQKMLK